jgi:hypothetical protein
MGKLQGRVWVFLATLVVWTVRAAEPVAGAAGVGRVGGGPEPLPPAPADFVYDGTRVLGEEERASLVSALSRFRLERGIAVYVAVFGYLLGESIDERATRLKEEWTGGAPGVVVIYVRGSEQLTFATTEGMESSLSRDDMVEIFSRAAVAARGDPGDGRSHAGRVTVASEQLLAELGKRLDEAETTRRAFRKRLAVMAAGFMAVLAGLVAGGVWAGRWWGRVSSRGEGIYYFPRVQVPPRFGAGSGGGVMADAQVGARRRSRRRKAV